MALSASWQEGLKALKCGCSGNRKGVFVCMCVSAGRGVVSPLGSMKGKLSGVQQSVWDVAQEKAPQAAAGRRKSSKVPEKKPTVSFKRCLPACDMLSTLQSESSVVI